MENAQIKRNCYSGAIFPLVFVLHNHVRDRPIHYTARRFQLSYPHVVFNSNQIMLSRFEVLANKCIFDANILKRSSNEIYGRARREVPIHEKTVLFNPINIYQPPYMDIS